MLVSEREIIGVVLTHVDVRRNVELLKDETSDIDLVGPTLQSLKILLEKPGDLISTDDKYENVIHGLLSACLVNVDEMRYGLLKSCVGGALIGTTLSEGDKGQSPRGKSRPTS